MLNALLFKNSINLILLKLFNDIIYLFNLIKIFRTILNLFNSNLLIENCNFFFFLKVTTTKMSLKRDPIPVEIKNK
jgi:hypothetical protein